MSLHDISVLKKLSLKEQEEYLYCRFTLEKNDDLKQVYFYNYLLIQCCSKINNSDNSCFFCSKVPNTVKQFCNEIEYSIEFPYNGSLETVYNSNFLEYGTRITYTLSKQINLMVLINDNFPIDDIEVSIRDTNGVFDIKCVLYKNKIILNKLFDNSKNETITSAFEITLPLSDIDKIINVLKIKNIKYYTDIVKNDGFRMQLRNIIGKKNKTIMHFEIEKCIDEKELKELITPLLKINF